MAPSPSMLNIAEVRRQIGSQRTYEFSAEVGELQISDAAIAPPGDVDVQVTVESQSTGVVAHGTVTVPWVGTCRRCLGTATGTVEGEFLEVFADDPASISEDEVLALHGNMIDLGEVIHDAAVLTLPLAPLCGEDCTGAAPELYPIDIATNHEESSEADGSDRPMDPRWAALSALNFDEDAK